MYSYQQQFLIAGEPDGAAPRLPEHCRVRETLLTRLQGQCGITYQSRPCADCVADANKTERSPMLGEAEFHPASIVKADSGARAALVKVLVVAHNRACGLSILGMEESAVDSCPWGIASHYLSETLGGEVASARVGVASEPGHDTHCRRLAVDSDDVDPDASDELPGADHMWCAVRCGVAEKWPSLASSPATAWR